MKGAIEVTLKIRRDVEFSPPDPAIAVGSELAPSMQAYLAQEIATYGLAGWKVAGVGAVVVVELETEEKRC